MKKFLFVFSILLLFATPCLATNAVTDMAKAGVDARSSTVAIVDKNLSIDGATPLILEGDTEDAYETSVAVTDPTADHTITLPDASGTVVLNIRTVTAKTSSYPVVLTDMEKVFTNTGAGGAVTFTLPEASTWIGRRVTFCVTAAQNLVINPADASDTIIGLTNAAGDSVTNATIGGILTLMAIDATNIVNIGSQGTWADTN